jgi:hypothetical protein
VERVCPIPDNGGWRPFLVPATPISFANKRSLAGKDDLPGRLNEKEK